MDIRSTNHWYHLFDSVAKWAQKQPRKLLWERNSRFYIPSKHGSWEDFSHMVRIQTEQGTNNVNNIWSGIHAGGKDSGTSRQPGDRSIWGPERPLDDKVDFDDDPTAPTSFEKDKYTWGVGEEADLITFNPLFDPDGTTWLLADDTTGYNITQGRPPRRTAIITASRLSRKLLVDMHKETTLNHHSMFSEMWPASCALHHGLKVVYAPHAEYIDRKWPIEYLDSIFNGGRNGATGGTRTSVVLETVNITLEAQHGTTMRVSPRCCGIGGLGRSSIMREASSMRRVARAECVCQGCCCIRSRGWNWCGRGGGRIRNRSRQEVGIYVVSLKGKEMYIDCEGCLSDTLPLVPAARLASRRCDVSNSP